MINIFSKELTKLQKNYSQSYTKEFHRIINRLACVYQSYHESDIIASSSLQLSGSITMCLNVSWDIIKVRIAFE